MLYSGVDWSGSPGPAHGPYIVLAAIHVDEADLPAVATELVAAAGRLSWPDNYVFKHTGAKPVVHREFYQALCRIPFTAHVHMLDKAAWHAQYGGKGSRGADCIRDGICSLILGCPDWITADQTLYIDLPHKERTTITKYRQVIRSSLIGADRETFRRIKARPDNRRDGGLIQIADMISGEVAEHRGIKGPHLTSLASRIVLV